MVVGAQDCSLTITLVYALILSSGEEHHPIPRPEEEMNNEHHNKMLRNLIYEESGARGGDPIGIRGEISKGFRMGCRIGC